MTHTNKPLTILHARSEATPDTSRITTGTRMPATFSPLHSGWTVKALNPEAVPEQIREAVLAGLPAQVPGEVTLDLLRAGLIADPFDGNSESTQHWIGEVDWRYSCHFDWPSMHSERLDLVAYGLDTVADLEINGRPLGHTQNFHRTYRWDLRGLLKEEGNELAVSFTSPVREAERREEVLGAYPHTEHHPFNQLRKPAYQFGWDWGIDAVNAGIWQPIGIDSWSGLRIKAVRPLVDVLPNGDGRLDLTLEVERADHEEGSVDFDVTVSGHGLEQTAQGRLEKGRNSASLSLVLPQVKLWWPRGYGDQPLYTVRVAVVDKVWSGRVGFRKVQVDTRADRDGRPFRIYVNDVPIHARGYNWVPVDAFITRGDRAVYSARFRDLVESNSNMVRAWGGSIYETDDFYELADESGIMVWQDFPLACAAYPEDAGTRAEIEAEAREQINRLSPHPSLVVWNGSNETYKGYADWDGFKQGLRDDDQPANLYGYGEKGWGDYYYTELFPGLLRKMDPTRIYLPSSPMSFTKYVYVNHDTDGTMHLWDVWNDTDYRQYRQFRPRFADEFGYQAPPAWSTLKRVVHDPDPDPFGQQMLVHQKASGGNVKLARGMRSHLTPGRFEDISYKSDGSRDWLLPSDRWADLEDWHWACQLQQAQAIRFGVEHMRSLEPLNAGTLVWQLNDDWPVVSWSAVDYDGHRKPLWFVSRDVFSPRFATIQPRVSEQAVHDRSWEGTPVDPDQLALILINDCLRPYQGQWKVERKTVDGRVLAVDSYSVSITANGQVTLPLDPSLSTFGDPSKEILVATPQPDDTDGTFPRTIFNPAEVIDQDLEPNPLAVEITAQEGGYLMNLRAQSYARDIFCMVDKVDPDASIEEGMVTLLPGETATWFIHSTREVDPQAFADRKVLRLANDLKMPSR